MFSDRNANPSLAKTSWTAVAEYLAVNKQHKNDTGRLAREYIIASFTTSEITIMAMTITAYLDCVSPYSYFALIHLEAHRDTLASHDVEIDIVPVFLGGINVGSGNKPPWTLPAKAQYSTFDSARAKAYFGAPNIKTPSFFPVLSLLPQRALLYMKTTYPSTYINAFLDIFKAMWEQEQDVSQPELLARVLSQTHKEAEIHDILEKANSAEWKGLLNEKTKEALERGAFGCPWFWVRNSKGVEEPFFGSDRFHFMWEFLGLPWKDIELPVKGQAKARI